MPIEYPVLKAKPWWSTNQGETPILAVTNNASPIPNNIRPKTK